MASMTSYESNINKVNESSCRPRLHVLSTRRSWSLITDRHSMLPLDIHRQRLVQFVGSGDRRASVTLVAGRLQLVGVSKPSLSTRRFGMALAIP